MTQNGPKRQTNFKEINVKFNNIDSAEENK
jgi:hypothetical protein